MKIIDVYPVYVGLFCYRCYSRDFECSMYNTCVQWVIYDTQDDWAQWGKRLFKQRSGYGINYGSGSFHCETTLPRETRSSELKFEKKVSEKWGILRADATEVIILERKWSRNLLQSWSEAGTLEELLHLSSLLMVWNNVLGYFDYCQLSERNTETWQVQSLPYIQVSGLSKLGDAHSFTFMHLCIQARVTPPTLQLTTSLRESHTECVRFGSTGLGEVLFGYGLVCFGAFKCQYHLAKFAKCTFKSTDDNPLLSDLFVGQNGRFHIMIGQIICQSNSLRRVNWEVFDKHFRLFRWWY